MKKKINKKKIAIGGLSAMAIFCLVGCGFVSFGINALQAKAVGNEVLLSTGGKLGEGETNGYTSYNSLVIPSPSSDVVFDNFTLWYYPSTYGVKLEEMPSVMEIKFVYELFDDDVFKYTLYLAKGYNVDFTNLILNEVLASTPGVSTLIYNIGTAENNYYLRLPSSFSLIFTGSYNYYVESASPNINLPYIWVNDISKSNAVDNQFQDGYNKGYYEGKLDGINEGRNEGTNALNAMSWLFGSIVNIPIIVLNGLSEFSVWGLSVIGIAVTLVFVTLVVWLVKKFI